MRTIRTPRKPRYSGNVTLATRLLAIGQRLRANETATATTFNLGYAAKYVQATAGGAR